MNFLEFSYLHNLKSKNQNKGKSTFRIIFPQEATLMHGRVEYLDRVFPDKPALPRPQPVVQIPDLGPRQGTYGSSTIYVGNQHRCLLLRDQCNTSIESLCRGFKSQSLSWPFVELTCHFVQMGLRIHRQVGSFRKILSQQTIGVLIGTALPWTFRIGKCTDQRLTAGYDSGSRN